MINPLELNMKVVEVPTDLSRCYTCKEVIFGKMYQYVLDDGNELSKPYETQYKLCESCYKLADE